MHYGCIRWLKKLLTLWTINYCARKLILWHQRCCTELDNELLMNVSNLVKCILLADDTSLFCSDANINRLFERVSSVLASMCRWFAINKLSLNVLKTSYMVFRNNTAIDTELYINGVCLERVRVAQFLGVLIDEHLNWKPHIASVQSELSKTTAILYKCSQIMNEWMKMNLLGYTCKIYNSCYNTEMINKQCNAGDPLETPGGLYRGPPSMLINVNTIKRRACQTLNQVQCSITMNKVCVVLVQSLQLASACE